MIFTSFGCNKYEKAIDRITREAQNTNLFRKICTHKFFSLQFMIRHCMFVIKHWTFILNNPRGFGYWIWKPYIILHTLEHECNENEALLYLDAGCSFGAFASTKIPELFENTTNILGYQLPHMEYQYTKRDTIEEIYPEVDIYSGQTMGGVILLINTHETRRFVKEWYNYAIKDNYRYINDVSLLPNYEGFIDHRHDQSIFSLLVKKYNIMTVPDDTYHEDTLFYIKASRKRS